MRTARGLAFVMALVLAGVTGMVVSSTADRAVPAGGSRVDVSPETWIEGVVKTEGLESFVLREVAVAGETAGRTVTITVTDETKFFVGHKPASPGDVKVGRKVRVQIKGALVDDAATALIVRVEPKNTDLIGMIESVSRDPGGNLISFVLSTTGKDAGKVITISVTPGTKYNLRQKPGAQTDVKVKDKAGVLIKGALEGDTATALIVWVYPLNTEVKGIVQSISAGGLTSFVLSGTGKDAGKLITVSVTADTKYYWDQKPGSSSDVKVNDRAGVLIKGPLTGTTGTALIVWVYPPE